MDFVDNEEKYSWEDILTMFGGFKYFSKEHLLCLWHRVNGRDDDAKVYQDIIDEEANKVRQALKKMLTPEEIEEIKPQEEENNVNPDHQQAEALALVAGASEGLPDADQEI